AEAPDEVGIVISQVPRPERSVTVIVPPAAPPGWVSNLSFEMMSEFTTGTPMLPTLKHKLAALPGAACNEVNNSPPFTPGAANAILGSVTNSSSPRVGSLRGATAAVTVLAAQAVFAFPASRARLRICPGVSPASNGTRTAHSARLVPSPDCTVGT